MKLRKGVINFIDNNQSLLQTTQIEGLSGEVADGVERYQAFGLSTFPMPCNPDGKGAEAIIADLGSSSMRTVIAVDDRRYRPTQGSKGDVIMYGVHDTPTATHTNATQRLAFTDDGTGNYRCILKINQATIEIKSDGTITLSNPGASIVMLNSGDVNINCANLNVTGNTTFTGQVHANGHPIDETHTHKSVQPGSGSSGNVN